MELSREQRLSNESNIVTPLMLCVLMNETKVEPNSESQEMESFSNSLLFSNFKSGSFKDIENTEYLTSLLQEVHNREAKKIGIKPAKINIVNDFEDDKTSGEYDVKTKSININEVHFGYLYDNNENVELNTLFNLFELTYRKAYFDGIKNIVMGEKFDTNYDLLAVVSYFTKVANNAYEKQNGIIRENKIRITQNFFQTNSAIESMMKYYAINSFADRECAKNFIKSKTKALKNENLDTVAKLVVEDTKFNAIKYGEYFEGKLSGMVTDAMQGVNLDGVQKTISNKLNIINSFCNSYDQEK